MLSSKGERSRPLGTKM